MYRWKRPAQMAPWPVFLGLLCCGGSTTISLSTYKTTCTTAGDCVPIHTGDVCGCACPNGAINSADEERYTADFNQARNQCGSVPVCTTLCVAPQVACTAGACALGK